MKIPLILTFVVVALLSYTQANIKLLRKVNIVDVDLNRKETFSLKNENTPEEELVIAGIHTQSIHPKDSNEYVYRIETVYIADKDGYRVKYKLVREPNIAAVFLSPSTLKSIAG